MKPGTTSVVTPGRGWSGSRGNGRLADSPFNRSVTVSNNPTRVASNGALSSDRLAQKKMHGIGGNGGSGGRK